MISGAVIPIATPVERIEDIGVVAVVVSGARCC